ncbi:Ig-like domain-containing protein [Acerihabitans arboris]|uniref:Uncharacterized protein n=1 Tax=Acerihabitans arboris TaxID=2691583 RepID=A0A845SIC0_9GAMM|nr:Ig-like domain-containing protein [Acerihabitans arboris]NDL63679.1 hypothetical protein [Acerihabitans arboris]
MPNHISITATPQFQPWEGALKPPTLTARVWDSSTDEPVPNLPVTFSIGLSHDEPIKRSARTDRLGQAKTTIEFDDLPGGKFAHNALIPVTANIAGDCAALDLFFYNKELFPIYITNLVNGNIIDEHSAAAGVQAIILPLAESIPGYVYQLFWGSKSVERAYNGVNFPWVVDIQQLFGNQGSLTNGSYRVYYKVMDNAANKVFSQPVDIKVSLNKMHKPTLLAPTLLPDCLYGVINLPAAIAGITIAIPDDQPEISSEDYYQVYLDTATFDGTLLNHILLEQGKVDHQHGIQVKIPLKDLQGYDGVNGDFYYTILNDREEVIHRSWLTRTIIDTTPRSR